MKIVIFFGTILVLTIIGNTASIHFTGVTASQKLAAKHRKSGLIGLERKIEYFTPDGEVRSWEGRYKVEIEGSRAQFIHSNKVITICGDYIITEVD
jgi:hypothetical protein